MRGPPRELRVALPDRGGEMACLEFGPPHREVDVVFAHANGFNARTYRTVLGPIGDLRILAVDLRGHGRSRLPPRTEGRDGWGIFRDDLLALVETLDLGPVVMAGHSMGATSSLLAAAARPGIASALALFEPVLMASPGAAPEIPDSGLAEGAARRRPDFPSRQAAFDAYHRRGAFRTWSDAQLLDYVTDGFVDSPNGGVTLACTPAWEASNFHAHNHLPWAPAVEAYGGPIRILRGVINSTTHIDGWSGLARAKRLTVETIAAATHFLPLERPELVAATLRELAA